MTGEDSVPDTVARRVREVGAPVASEDLNVWREVREVEDRTYKLRAVVQAWERQHAEDRSLRKRYAMFILVILASQVVLGAAAFFMIGYGCIQVAEWVANVFFLGVFGDVAGLALIVTRYLFRETARDAISLIEKL